MLEADYPREREEYDRMMFEILMHDAMTQEQDEVMFRCMNCGRETANYDCCLECQCYLHAIGYLNMDDMG